MARLSARDIAAIIAARIRHGEPLVSGGEPAKTGSLVPSRPQLAEAFDTSSGTIARALDEVRRLGLIHTHQGRGTVVTNMPKLTRDVRDRYLPAQRLEDRGSFAAEVRRQAMAPRSDTTISRMVPPSEVAGFLGITEGDEVVCRYREMFADDLLVQVAPSYIPLDVAGGTLLEDLVQPKGGMLTTMQQLGHEEDYADEYLELSRPPTEAECDKFGISQDQPVFELYHVAYSVHGRVVEVSHHVGPVHRWGKFIYRVQIKGD